ncbi:unnamed protein product [Chrysoparadoxa australica]|tara:strand:+ start:1580 stop:2575 length:996 start_codon:yes stop_codon:yes gene_type:complete
MKHRSHEHLVRIDVKKPLPEKLDVGAPFVFDLVVEPKCDCDLTGIPWNVIDASGAKVAEGRLPDLHRPTPESDEYDPRHGPVDMRPSAPFILTAPATIGFHEWKLLLPTAVKDGVAHTATDLSLSFSTRGHRLSMSVWDHPSPVAKGESFSLKIGAKCSSNCSLAGQQIKIVDAEGAVVTKSCLRDSLWTGTNALYWTEVELTAPKVEGLHRWLACADAPNSALPHDGSAKAGFSFVVTQRPKNRVSVKLTDKTTGAPVSGAHVRFGPFHCFTNNTGIAVLNLPNGNFTLIVSKPNHEVKSRHVAVTENLEMKVDVIVHPEPDPYERYWKT